MKIMKIEKIKFLGELKEWVFGVGFTALFVGLLYLLIGAEGFAQIAIWFFDTASGGNILK